MPTSCRSTRHLARCSRVWARCANPNHPTLAAATLARAPASLRAHPLPCLLVPDGLLPCVRAQLRFRAAHLLQPAGGALVYKKPTAAQIAAFPVVSHRRARSPLAARRFPPARARMPACSLIAHRRVARRQVGAALVIDCNVWLRVRMGGSTRGVYGTGVVQLGLAAKAPGQHTFGGYGDAWALAMHGLTAPPLGDSSEGQLDDEALLEAYCAAWRRSPRVQGEPAWSLLAESAARRLRRRRSRAEGRPPRDGSTPSPRRRQSSWVTTRSSAAGWRWSWWRRRR